MIIKRIGLIHLNLYCIRFIVRQKNRNIIFKKTELFIKICNGQTSKIKPVKFDFFFENTLPSNSMNVNIIKHYTITVKARNDCSIDRRLFTCRIVSLKTGLLYNNALAYNISFHFSHAVSFLYHMQFHFYHAVSFPPCSFMQFLPCS